MAELKPGTKMDLVDCAYPHAEIVKLLGEGGQGAVYEVKVGGKAYALKWYNKLKLKNKDAFRENLRKNIEEPSRSMADCPEFLWPKFLTKEKDGTFGYVMDLRPKEYTDFTAILNAKADFASTEVMILAALNLVSAFQKLHWKGLSYHDLNNGNFFIDTTSGDVLICDNDNVTPDGAANPGGVGGKPGYMAPEIVRGEAKPSRETDYYSLAVVLFKLFFRDNPLQGAEYEREPFLTEKREYELLGVNPVFVYDPNDESNRPVEGIHHNVIKLWPLYPRFFRKEFEYPFAEGLKKPEKRNAEGAWLKALIRLRDEWVIVCPACGKDILLTNHVKGKEILCSRCTSLVSYPKILSINKDKNRVPLFPGKKLYAWHTASNNDYKTITAEVVMNKNAKTLWGIKNLSQGTWKMKTPDGAELDVPPSGGIPIGKGVSIDFNGIAGIIGEEE